MKKLYLLALLGFASCGYASDTNLVATKTTPKIGYIKLEQIISPDKPAASAHEWRDRIEKLQKELEKRGKSLMAEDEKFKKTVTDFEAKEKSKLLSEEARAKQRDDIIKARNELGTKIQAHREYASQESQKIQMEVLGKVEKIVKDLASKKSLDLVLVGGALYVSQNIDLTTEVLTALNKEYDATQKKAPAKK